MTDNPQKCEYCGTPLKVGAEFCDACGQQVRKPSAELPVYQAPASPPTMVSPKIEIPTPTPVSPPASTYKPAPAYVPPPAQSKGSKTLPIILGAVGCLVILCVFSCAVLAFIALSNRSQTPDVSKLVSVEPALEPLPTDAPLPTKPILATKAPLPGEALAPTQVPLATQIPTPTLVPPVEDPSSSSQGDVPVLVWPSDIGQQLTDAYFSDDFSSTEYDWWEVEDETQTWGIEDEHYALHLLTPNYSSWAYPPIEFTPTTIGFDAAVLPGFEQGAYGVMCYYQDENNYYFISVDPVYQEYSIGYIRDGEYETLMEDMWMPAKALKDDNYEINNVMVVCDPDMITLFVNNEFEAQADVSSVTGGVAAIYGETWEDTPSSGFKVLFDNLYAFKPVQ
jgi:hypothetical protein